MKRLLIDCSYIKVKDDNFPGSLALYAGRLLQGFSCYSVFRVTALVWKGNEKVIDDLAGYEVDKIVVDDSCKVTPWRKLDRLLGLISFKDELKRRGIDVVLTPYHLKCSYYFPKQYHQFMIAQDLIPYYSLKETHGNIIYFRWCISRRLLLRNVKCFISISEKTKQDLMHFEGKDSIVIYNSLPFDFSIKEKEIDEISGKKYILDVNRFAKYKNAETLICAFSILKNVIPHVLYLKGDEFHANNRIRLEKLVKDLGLYGRVIFDKTYRSEGEIRYLYAHADLFISPSLQEGFGWTPIEAAILETPVLISDIDVLKEVSCNKLPTFNPHSPEDLASKILELLDNPPNIEKRKQLSKFYLERYSLKKQINNLTDVILRNYHPS